MSSSQRSEEEAHAGHERLERYAVVLFKSAQRNERHRFYAQLCLLVTALAALSPSDQVTYWAAVAALLAGTSVLLFRMRTQRRRHLAHAFHRGSVLSRAFSVEAVQIDVGDLILKLPHQLHARANELESDELNRYDYHGESVTNDGQQRLRWMIHENAFFEKTLYGDAKGVALARMFLALAVAFFALIIALYPSGPSLKDVILRIAVSLLSFFVAFDLIEQWSNWKAAARMMSDLEAELSQSLRFPDHRLVAIFSAYTTAFAVGNEVPYKVYERERAKLNEAWKAKVAALTESWENGLT